MRLILVALLTLVLASALGQTSAQQTDAVSRVALVIGNANYQDAEAPLKDPVGDARAVAQELRRAGFEVDVGENLSRAAMQRAFDRLYAKIRPGSIVLVFFSGYGIQSNRQSYLIPVDAHIWTEAEVRRDGISLDTVLTEIGGRGATTEIAILDASRRNPFERHYRLTPAGLAPLNPPHGGIIMYSAAPGALTDEPTRGAFVSELIKQIATPGLAVEEVFNRTSVAVSRASRGEQVPWFSSALSGDFSFDPKSSAVADNKTTAAPQGKATPPDASKAALAPEPKIEPRTGAKPEPQAETKAAALEPPKPEVPPVKNTPPDAGRPMAAPVPKNVIVDPVKPMNAPKPATAPADVSKQAALAAEASKQVATPEPKAEPKPAPVTDVSKQTSGADGVVARLEPQTDAAKSSPSNQPVVNNPADAAAIKGLDAKLQKDPNDAAAYYKRGQLYSRNGVFSAAAADFDASLRLNPKDPEAFNNRCWARAMFTDLQMALQDCNEALRLRPGFAEALDSRALVYLKLDMSKNAIADYDAALKIKPDMASSLYGRGVGKLRIGNVAEGYADIAAAKAIDAGVATEFASYGIR